VIVKELEPAVVVFDVVVAVTVNEAVSPVA
jgi:hypothetical protein